MLEEEEEEDIILGRALIEQMMRRKRRRWNVRPLNTNRTEQGEFYLLVQQMRETDEETHFAYFRMSRSRFDDLVKRISPFL